MTTYGIQIKSNDGQTDLTDYFESFSKQTVTVTSTGVVLSDSPSTNYYTYTGTKTFIGLSKEVNAVVPTYPVGSTFDLPSTTGLQDATTYYIVEESTPKVTVDLTSLSGYESLAAGTYQLGVKAKASGYQDSDLSQTVSFTKLAAPVATAADTTVTWDAVTNAESYDVYVDGELYENTDGGG